MTHLVGPIFAFIDENKDDVGLSTLTCWFDDAKAPSYTHHSTCLSPLGISSYRIPSRDVTARHTLVVTSLTETIRGRHRTISALVCLGFRLRAIGVTWLMGHVCCTSCEEDSKASIVCERRQPLLGLPPSAILPPYQATTHPCGCTHSVRGGSVRHHYIASALSGSSCSLFSIYRLSARRQ